MPEWTPYGFDLARIGDDMRGPKELTVVHHVAHVAQARTYLADGRIPATQIYDESRLRGSSTHVAWLSANTWGPGSLYGNVQFSFSWTDLIDGRDLYWVEPMQAYNPTAYRLLVTDRDMRGSNIVQPYDAERDEGPIRLHKGRWYWNGNFTSEFMLETTLNLDSCTDFDFIKHREDRCRLHGSACPDRKTPTFEIGGRVVATLLGNRLHQIDHILEIPISPQRPLHRSIYEGLSGIVLKFKFDTKFESRGDRPPSLRALARRVLKHYGNDQSEQALTIASEFRSWEEFKTGLERLVDEHFGMNDFALID